MLTVLASYRFVLVFVFFISFLFLKNWILSINKSLVFLSPFTREYSHERIPKKRAPVISWPIASSSGENLLLYIDLNTCSGKHFW